MASQPPVSATRKTLVFLGASAVTVTFIINLCAAVFRCGCQAWWAGAAEHCNIHRPGSRHCPWCSFGNAGFLLALALILAPQFAVSVWPSDWSWRKRLLAALAVFPVIGCAVGLAFGWFSGYWA